MFIPEVDATTGHASYWSYALPGTDDSDAAWRILKWSWATVGDQIVGTRLWADGNGNFDNVRANRASLTYSANPAVAVKDYLDVVPSGVPGSSFTVPFAIPDDADLWLDSTPMRKVTDPPVGNQYRLTGASAFDTGEPVESGAWFFLRVPLVTGALLLCALMGFARAQTVTALPPVGGDVRLLAAPIQDPYACGDAVLAAAEAIRARGGGGFDLPVNCPRMLLRWPYVAERTGTDLFIVNTIDRSIVVRLPPAAASTSGAVAAPTKRARLTAGAAVHLLEVGGRRTP